MLFLLHSPLYFAYSHGDQYKYIILCKIRAGCEETRTTIVVSLKDIQSETKPRPGGLVRVQLLPSFIIESCDSHKATLSLC